MPGLVPVVLTATAETGPPALLVKVSGDEQSRVVGTLLDAPLGVRVTDTHGNPVAGSTITFGPASGDGSVFPTQATSDSNGTAATEWTLGSSQGSQSVGASIETGAMVIFTATATGENGVGGLAIELLFVDQPTALQSQAFDDAVSRWAALIPGKLEPVPVNLAAGAGADAQLPGDQSGSRRLARIRVPGIHRWSGGDVGCGAGLHRATVEQPSHRGAA